MSHLFDAMVKLTRARAAGIPAPVSDVYNAAVADARENAQRQPHAEALTHLAVWDAPHTKGTRKSLCGAVVAVTDLAHDGLPTCAECRLLNDEDERNLEALR